MPFDITTTVECCLLPEDGATAEAAFLQHLADPHEMYIIAYAFSLTQMVDHFLQDAPDANLHIYIDSTQAGGKYEKPAVQKLIKAGIEITIGTSPAGSQFICHTKGMVCNDVPTPFCWEGSTNFSASAWHQVNTAMMFNSQDYYNQFVNQFLNLRYFAWTKERSKQVMKKPPAGALTPPPPMGSGSDSSVPAILAGARVPASDAPVRRASRNGVAAPRRKTSTARKKRH